MHFLPKNRIDDHSSPETLSLAKLWIAMFFLNCLLAIVTISLGPLDNVKGGLKFVSSAKGQSLKQHSWATIPMTQGTIDEVSQCGNDDGNINHNEFECDDIKGVCDCNIQHNLNPQNKNDNNHINQIDDNNDSSCSDSKQQD